MPEDVDFSRKSYSLEEIETIAEKYRSWDKWGSDDELGSANYVTPETVVAAARLVRTGRSFSLALPLDLPAPQSRRTSRVNPQHIMLCTPNDPLFDDNGLQRFSDDAVYMPLQSGTQWDALCHIFHRGLTYNNRDANSVNSLDGARFNSITNLKDRSIGRGVLLDVARWAGRSWLEPGESIQAIHLQECAAAQGVEVREGDFVLVRTGQIAHCRALGAWGDYDGGPAPGLGVSAADFLCPHNIVAVATDTWGVETKPYESTGMVAPLHVVFLVNAGIYMGEMWDLEDLASDCAEDGVYEFLVAAQPLTITGSVGSPLNPVAVK